MFAIPRKSNRIVLTKPNTSFRDDEVVLGNFLSLTEFRNPYRHYGVVTDRLSAGDYKFSVKSYDNLGNYSNLVTGNVTVGDFRLFPRFLNLERVNTTNEIKLSWTVPFDGTPDNYKIYSNNGDGSYDFTLYDTIDGSLLSKNYALSSGTWMFKVEAIRDSKESYNLFSKSVLVPFANIIPPDLFDVNRQITSIDARNVHVGKIQIAFLWLYGSIASNFRLYHDRGSGTIHYSSFIEFDRQSGYYQKHTTPQIYTGEEDAQFKFVVRAVSPNGIEDGNTVEHTVTLDGVQPVDPDSLNFGTGV